MHINITSRIPVSMVKNHTVTNHFQMHTSMSVTATTQYPHLNVFFFPTIESMLMFK